MKVSMDGRVEKLSTQAHASRQAGTHTYTHTHTHTRTHTHTHTHWQSLRLGFAVALEWTPLEGLAGGPSARRISLDSADRPGHLRRPALCPSRALQQYYKDSPVFQHGPVLLRPFAACPCPAHPSAQDVRGSYCAGPLDPRAVKHTPLQLGHGPSCSAARSAVCTGYHQRIDL